MDNHQTPKFAFTIPEACHSLGIGRSKAYELMHQGHLVVLKIGRRTLIKADSIVKLVEGA